MNLELNRDQISQNSKREYFKSTFMDKIDEINLNFQK